MRLFNIDLAEITLEVPEEKVIQSLEDTIFFQMIENDQYFKTYKQRGGKSI